MTLRSAQLVRTQKPHRSPAPLFARSGPWQRLATPVLAPRPGFWDATDISNAAPLVLPNGSVLLGYRAGGDGVALGGGIGVARAPSWQGPYERAGDSAEQMLFAAEDGARARRLSFQMAPCRRFLTPCARRLCIRSFTAPPWLRGLRSALRALR